MMMFINVDLKRCSIAIFNLLIILNFVNCEFEAPILDVDQNNGYLGTINEKNILVELKPHVQIKNIDKINGICSYHVYKPNEEEFPFVIEIKNKNTGEIIIQVSSIDDSSLKKPLDCRRKRFYKFLLEAHDCTEPVSIASEKIPVTIEVLDHDDTVPKFEEDNYYRDLYEDQINDLILTLNAKDSDCTNNGNACDYKIILSDEDEMEFDEYPFKINSKGYLSNVIKLNRSVRAFYDFKVRAYDCLNNVSYSETNIHIEILEKCVPKWIINDSKLKTNEQRTQVYPKIIFDQCPETIKQEDVEFVESKISLDLNLHSNGCELKECGEVLTKLELIETGYDEEKDGNIEPKTFLTFSSSTENVKKSNFNGNFGKEFVLKAKIRLNKHNKKLKEHVFCGSDAELLNRHHYGLYFFNKNLKFLLRKEKINSKSESSEFYPSLWEWQLDDDIINDRKWHTYEIRYLSDNDVNLFIDSKLYHANRSNSDIIDAYKLDSVTSSGTPVTYIGACYHARSKQFSNYFNGDIAYINLYTKNPSKKIECVHNCKEYLELINDSQLSVKTTQYMDEIKINTTSLEDAVETIRKIYFINKNVNDYGMRYILLDAKIKLKSQKEMVSLKQSKIEIDVKKTLDDVELSPDLIKLTTTIDEIKKSGIKPFSDLKIYISSDSDEIDDLDDENNEANMLKKCIIRVLTTESGNFLMKENIIQKYKLKLEKNLNEFIVTSSQPYSIYEEILNNLIYTNSNGQKEEQISLKCEYIQPTRETNTIRVNIDVIEPEVSYIARKQIHKFTSDDQVIQSRLLDGFTDGSIKNSLSSPLIVMLILVSVGSAGLIVILVAYRIKSTTSSNRKNSIINEENPQMEWDDSGLNITENPLESINISSSSPNYYDDQYSINTNDSINDENFNMNDEEIDDDYELEEENEIRVVNGRELEWDDTPLELDVKK